MKQLAWHPWSGCSPVSPSCLNCYAVPASGDLVHQTARGPIFNGKLKFNEAQISVPADTPAPACFVVCPHGDTFHENAPDAWLDRVFDVMEREDRHIFSINTKRGDRMLGYLTARYDRGRAPAHIDFGIGAERQKEANERVAALMSAPVTIRHITFFALQGPIDVHAIPGVDAAELKTVHRVHVGDGWLTASANPAWSRKVIEDFRDLGVRVFEDVLLESAALRGF
jgi:protein gp37